MVKSTVVESLLFPFIVSKYIGSVVIASKACTQAGLRCYSWSARNTESRKDTMLTTIDPRMAGHRPST